MEIQTGQVVEFLDDNRFVCAASLGSKGGKCRAITHLDRELVLSDSRITHISRQKIDTGSKTACLNSLAKIYETRDLLKKQIDLPQLWELVNEEKEIWSSEELTGLAFSGETTPDQEAALIRAVISERIHFRYRAGAIVASSQDTIEKLMEQRAARELYERRIADGALWVKSLWHGSEAADISDETLSFLKKALEDVCIRQEESEHTPLVRELFKKAGISSPFAPFYTLVKAGFWDEDENLELKIHGITATFEAELEKQADGIVSVADYASRLSLDGDIFTIDSAETKDIDDALSFRILPDGFELQVHITDIGYRIPPDTPLFNEVLSRATSIYLPDLYIPMLPEVISSDIGSLKQGEPRKCLTFTARLDNKFKVLDTSIKQTELVIKKRFTYDEVDVMLNANDNLFHKLYCLCDALERNRIENHALPLPLPELSITVSNRKPTVQLQHIGPARFLVSECMVLANKIAADFLVKHKLPALFRSQPPPRDRLFKGTTKNLKLNYRQRRLISKGILDTTPGFHSGLGLNAYTTVTSPLRRGLDLLMQQQITSFLSYHKPIFTKNDLDKHSMLLKTGLTSASAVTQTRNRYWTLKYLEGAVGKTFNAWILETSHFKTLAVLSDLLLTVELPRRPGEVHFTDEDMQVVVTKANARENILKVDWF